MKKKMILGMSMFTLLQAMPLMANLPVKYSKCEVARKIISPENSQGYYLSEDCKVAYVLPPDSGVIQVESYNSSGVDHGACDIINGELKSIERQLIRVEQSEKRLDAALKDLESNNDQITKLQKRCFKIDSELIKGNGLLTVQETKINIQKQKIQSLEAKIESCNTDVNSDRWECDDYKYDLETLNDKLETLERAKEKISEAVQLVENNKLICETERDAMIQYVSSQNDAYNQALEDLRKTRQDLRRSSESLNAQYGNKSGAVIQLSLHTKTLDLAKKFQENNSSLGIDFKPIDIRKGIVSFEQVDDPSTSLFPAIVRSNILGLGVANGNVSPAEFILSDTSNGSRTIGSSVAGSVVFNQLHACKIINDPSLRSSDDEIKKMASMLNSTMTFFYDLQVIRKYNVKYEESHLYQLIKKNSSSSGFFRSSSSSKITEKSEASKWIQVQFESQDSSYNFENEEKMADDLRKEYLNAALIRVAQSYLSNSQLSFVDPGKPGAPQVADGLRKSCAHPYCQYAAVAINLGSAVFGGSSSEASMTRKVSAKEAQEVIHKGPITYYGTLNIKVSK